MLIFFLLFYRLHIFDEDIKFFQEKLKISIFIATVFSGKKILFYNIINIISNYDIETVYVVYIKYFRHVNINNSKLTKCKKFKTFTCNL